MNIIMFALSIVPSLILLVPANSYATFEKPDWAHISSREKERLAGISVTNTGPEFSIDYISVSKEYHHWGIGRNKVYAKEAITLGKCYDDSKQLKKNCLQFSIKFQKPEWVNEVVPGETPEKQLENTADIYRKEYLSINYDHNEIVHNFQFDFSMPDATERFLKVFEVVTKAMNVDSEWVRAVSNLISTPKIRAKSAAQRIVRQETGEGMISQAMIEAIDLFGHDAVEQFIGKTGHQICSQYNIPGSVFVTELLDYFKQVYTDAGDKNTVFHRIENQCKNNIK